MWWIHMKNIVMYCLQLGTIMVSSHFVMPVRHIEPLKVSCSTSEFLIISCVMHYHGLTRSYMTTCSGSMWQTEQRINKLGVIVHRCWHGKAPQYPVDCCARVTDVVGRQRLRSATQQMMVVPRHQLSSVGRSICCARPHGLELLAGWPQRTAGLWVL